MRFRRPEHERQERAGLYYTPVSLGKEQQADHTTSARLAGGKRPGGGHDIVLPTVRKFAEQAKKDEFERSLAAEGIKSNITMNRNLTEGLAQATRQMGTTAAEQAGSALTSRFNY